MKTFWIGIALIFLFFIPGYAKTYFDYKRETKALADLAASRQRVEQMQQEALDHTRKTNAEVLRIMRRYYGFEKGL